MALRHAAAALILLLAAHAAAAACSCIDLSRSSAASLRARFAAAERIVHGRVSQALSPHEAQIEVLESFKGSGATLAAMRENDCAFQFAPGEEYVYFVYNSVVSLCGRVAPRAELLERLRALRIPDAAACEGVPRPQRPPGLAPSTEQDVRYEPLRGGDPDTALGHGHVRPANEADRDDWIRRLVLPVFAAPDGALKLWLVPGSVSPEAQVETGYETTSLIVLQARSDGWLLLRYGDPAAKDIGWVHRCHLEDATPRLQYEPWEKLLAEAAPLFFRAWVPHVLRESASPSSRAVAQIPADPNRYGIQPLEFQGDWARVRLSIPSRYCAERDVKSAVHEGWIRWRSAERGPWVWYYTRGC